MKKYGKVGEETKKGVNIFFFPFLISNLSMATQLRPSCKKSARGCKRKVGEFERGKLLLEQNIVENMYPCLCIQTSDTSHGYLKIAMKNYEKGREGIQKWGGIIFSHFDIKLINVNTIEASIKKNSNIV